MVVKLKYTDDIWDVTLPTVRAYEFRQEEIQDYLRIGGDHPLVFDMNLINRCNTNCVYCSTQGGKYDVRYPLEKSFGFVTDGEWREVVRQLPGLGVRTFFICSNGEPLLKSERFLGLAREAHEKGLEVVTYTNGTTLTPELLRELESLDVNLVMKLESLDPERNDGIILNTPERRKKSFQRYKYTLFGGEQIPDHIPRAFEIYGRDTGRLGLETMVIKDNTHEVLDIREWAYQELDCVQFLKHVYPLGYVQLRGRDIQPTEGEKTEIDSAVKILDASKGLEYPKFETPDRFSFDARRFINNVASASGFPFRIFGHERRGVYHSSQLVKKKLGFGTETIIEIFNEQGKVDMERYFAEIASHVEKEDVWRPGKK